MFSITEVICSLTFLWAAAQKTDLLYLNRNVLLKTSNIACDQALRGPLAAGQEKVEKLPPTSLEFEYLHRKRRCEILIDGDDISTLEAPKRFLLAVAGFV